jgi:hypothetical protein
LCLALQLTVSVHGGAGREMNGTLPVMLSWALTSENIGIFRLNFFSPKKIMGKKQE